MLIENKKAQTALEHYQELGGRYPLIVKGPTGNVTKKLDHNTYMNLADVYALMGNPDFYKHGR